MRSTLRVFAPAAVLLAVLVVPFAAVPGDTPKVWVCPPCNLPCDDAAFDQPGTCPKCGMALVDREAAKAALAKAPKRKKVAMLVFDGVEVIDTAGPWEVFGAAGFEVFAVAETKDPVTTAMGMKVVPKYAFADAPQPDVLVVPGGGVNGPKGSAATLAYVRSATARAAHTMSVCNGAFILASAGLLDGLTATTTAPLVDRLHTEFPSVKVVHDRRFVDNGKIITTGGLSAGIDGALHVVAVMNGKDKALAVAHGLEYDWRTESGAAPAGVAGR